jgi:hypothetical protein
MQPISEHVISIFLDKDGLNMLLALFELKSSENADIAHQLLQIVNNLSDKNPKCHERICMIGFLPYILKFGGPNNNKKIRIEVAFNIGLA